MTDALSHTEIQELLGAYALDAVDERERRIIDAHLQTCESCQVELDDHRRLAETLRRHANLVSPLASTASNGSANTNGAITQPGPLRRWGVPTAMAMVLLLEGGLFVQGQARYHQLAATTARVELLERAQLAAADPVTVVTSLRTPRHAAVLTVVDRGGDSYAINSSLPRLAGGRSYELWRVDDAGLTAAAAALGPHPDAVKFSLPDGVTGFVVTVETSPAPSRPTLPAIATSSAVSS